MRVQDGFLFTFTTRKYTLDKEGSVVVGETVDHCVNSVSCDELDRQLTPEKREAVILGRVSALTEMFARNIKNAQG